MLNNQKRLVASFKDFFEKACLTLVKQHLPVLKEWLYFSSMISQQAIDFTRIQRYLQNLTTIQPNSSLSDTTKNFTLPTFNQSDPLGATFKKKKYDTKDNRFNYLPSHSSAVTIGEPIFNLRSYSENEVSKVREETVGNSRPKFKLTDAEVTKTMVSKLNCLYMTFVDNQHKIQFPKRQSQLPRRFSDMHEMIYK